MRLQENLDILAFLKAVQTCESEVLFCTPEGDKLDLKSLMSEYVFSALTLKEEILSTGWIELAEKDQPRLSAFART